MSVNPHERAYVAPFVVFMALLAAGELLRAVLEGRAWWVVATPQYWVFPLQTLVCGALIVRYWRFYEWHTPTKPLFATGVAVAVFAIWIAPQELFRLAERRTGFDPGFFGDHGWVWFTNIALRWLRLVLVVPLLEEIFWRGFLLRYLVRDDFTKVPFGTFSASSFGLVTVFFGLAHWGPDFGPAVITGALYNMVAYRTRSLSSCVLAHAVTNLLLGAYIMKTGQWGFW